MKLYYKSLDGEMQKFIGAKAPVVWEQVPEGAIYKYGPKHNWLLIKCKGVSLIDSIWMFPIENAGALCCAETYGERYLLEEGTPHAVSMP